jgi:alpha-L-rhamnosidase
MFGLETQTSYVLFLYYDIYKDREKVGEGFKARLAKDLYRIKTGFTGTSLMLPALMDAGMVNDAYRILFNESFPGWLYAVNLGATTLWERWNNSLLPDGRISGVGMNFLNHYSAGSVCEAIYSRIAGLRCAAPGWEEALIAPQPNYRLKRISLEFDSPFGTYKTAQEIHRVFPSVFIGSPQGTPYTTSGRAAHLPQWPENGPKGPGNGCRCCHRCT